MNKLKRICCLVWVCVCLNPVCAYAEPVQVSFDAQSTDYHESLEVYLSNENSYYCFKLGPDNAYDLTQEVEEGDYTVHAFSIGDANHYYSYTISPEKLTVNKGNSNQVMVQLQENKAEEAEEEEGDTAFRRTHRSLLWNRLSMISQMVIPPVERWKSSVPTSPGQKQWSICS